MYIVRCVSWKLNYFRILEQNLQNITPDIANTLCSVCANICNNNNKSKKSYLNCSFFQTTSVNATAHIFWPLWMMHRGRMQLKKKIIFFKMHIKKLVMSDTKKWKKNFMHPLIFAHTMSSQDVFQFQKSMKSKRSSAQYISFSTGLPLLWYDLSFFSDYSTWVGSRCESGTKILVWTGRKTDPVFGFFLKKFNR